MDIQIIKNIINNIDIVQCKNNKSVFISKCCPFCGENGRRLFRYNTKLKVGKSYCCGKSFKEIYWLQKQLEDPDFADKFQLENRHGLYAIISDELYEDIKNNRSMKESGIEKSKRLPF